MFDELARQLGIDPDSPSQLRADHLVKEDNAMLRRLRGVRMARGLSVETVAERMGVAVETVRDFERYDTDPTLSQLRRYAHAIGALVSHDVFEDPNGDGLA
jgi:transcriptional regulator with XRE-family HTH domain